MRLGDTCKNWDIPQRSYIRRCVDCKTNSHRRKRTQDTAIGGDRATVLKQFHIKKHGHAFSNNSAEWCSWLSRFVNISMLAPKRSSVRVWAWSEFLFLKKIIFFWVDLFLGRDADSTRFYRSELVRGLFLHLSSCDVCRLRVLPVTPYFEPLDNAVYSKRRILYRLERLECNTNAIRYAE